MMASDNRKRIKQLSDELKLKASALDHPGASCTSSAASDIMRRFVAGKGLLDIKSEGRKWPEQSSDDDEEQGDQQDSDDDEYKAEKNPSDSEATDDDDEYDDAIMLEFMNSVNVKNAIVAKYNLEPLLKVPGLRPEIVPMDHQQIGASALVKALKSPFKGLIVGDPPGLGKTLQVLMTIAATRSPGDGPCVVVCPPSCVLQWADEAAKFFYESDMKAIVITGERISPAELFKYRLVITSYSQVVSELVRVRKYLKEVKEYIPGTKLPKRPILTLLSDVFTFSSKHLGKMLILDEAHIIKNPRSRTYAAIYLLRQLFEACVMLTGTPLDNTWRDAYALMSLLGGHPIDSPRTMSAAFTSQGSRKKRNGVPRGKYLIRIIQVLDAVTIRRPRSTIQRLLTSLVTDVVQFVLPAREMSESNEEFRKYLVWQFMSKKKKAKMSASAKEQEKNKGFGALIKATHWANHPLLTRILELEKAGWRKNMNDDDPDDAIDLNENDQQMLEEWREHISRDLNWRSPRVDAIVDTVNKHRDWRPDDAIVIMDESVFFLDILAIAFNKTHEPVPCFRYDGRMHHKQRHVVLENFRAARGVRILLASRGTGGAGLNLQDANVLIQCGPWWKVSWEEQALGRIHRAGQTKPVFYYKIEAKGFGTRRFEFCKVEFFRKTKRDEKNASNVKIMNGVTREDDATPPQRICH